MFRLRSFLRTTSGAVIVCLTTAITVLFAAPAHAAVSVARAEVRGSDLRIEGTAAANRTITVDGTAMATSDGAGRFRVERSGYSPPADCTVDVNDGSATAVTARLSGCTVSETPPPASTSPTILPDVAELGPGNVGLDFSSESTSHVNFANGAVGPVQWEVIAGTLPAGLSVVPQDPAGRPTPIEEVTNMQIRGIPTTVQTSTFTLRATDANGVTATRTYTIRIEPATTLTITPDFQQLFVGENGNLWFRGGGGVLPYTWAVTAGELPAGMTLIQDNPGGELVRAGGTPAVAGTFNWTLRLTDAQGTVLSRDFTVTVSPAKPALSALTVNPTTVNGGTTATGTVTLDAPALDTTTVSLISSNPQAASVPGGVTLTPGSMSGTFAISTAAAAGNATVTIAGSYAGVTRSATLTVTASQSAQPALSSLTVNPTTVNGGTTATGTVTLDAPAGDTTTVTLASSNPQTASVPGSVTVAAGSTSGTFSISTAAGAQNATVTITGTYAGVSRSATLTVTAASTSADTVSISRAQYDGAKRILRVDATSSAAGATLRVYSTSTNTLIGTLSAGRGEFSVTSNPQSITVRSSLGGSATRTVTLK